MMTIDGTSVLGVALTTTVPSLFTLIGLLWINHSTNKRAVVLERTTSAKAAELADKVEVSDKAMAEIHVLVNSNLADAKNQILQLTAKVDALEKVARQVQSRVQDVVRIPAVPGAGESESH